MRGYTILGWIVWQIGKRVAVKKMAENRVKLGAVGLIALVVVGGVFAAKAGSSSND